MTFIERIKKEIGSLIILAFILFLIIGNHYGNIKQTKYRKEFKKSKFTGIITQKYRQKGAVIFFYRNVETNIETQINPSDAFANSAEINDTIIKLPDSNECIIKNSNKLIKVVCEYED